MINQVSTLKVNNDNIFADFSVGTNQYINLPEQKPDEYVSRDNQLKKSQIQLQSSKEIINDLLPEKKREKKWAKWVIAGVGAIGLSAIFFASGLRKNVYKFTQNIRSKLAKKVKPKDNHKGVRGIYETMLNGSNKLIERADAVNNWHSLKIIGAKKAMFAFSDTTPKSGMAKFLRNTYDKITQFFTKISRKTVIKSYAKTDKKMEKALKRAIDSKNKIPASQLNEHVTINGITKTKQEWLDDTTKLQQQIQNIYNKNFSTVASDSRYSQMLADMADLDVRFWDASYNYKNIKNNAKGMTESFVAQKLMANKKAELLSNVTSQRALISNNIADICSNINLSVKDIDLLINIKDIDTISSSAHLKSTLNKYIKATRKGERINRDEVINAVNADINLILQGIKSKPEMYSNDVIKKIETKLLLSQDILKNSKDGTVQEMMNIYKSILPEKEYRKLQKSMTKYTKSLSNSINTECSSFFDKLRDFSMGAAPFEVLDLLVGFAPLAYFMARAKDKDKRISIGLKYGVPTVASIATSMYCTAGLLSGGKALAFGLAVGFITNRICNHIDKIRLDTKQNQMA